MAALWAFQFKDRQDHFLKDFSVTQFAKFTHSLFGGRDGGYCGEEKTQFKHKQRREKYTTFLRKSYRALPTQGNYVSPFKKKARKL